MENTKLFEEIQKVKEYRKDGKGYLEIREELEAKGYQEEEIKSIIKKVNDDELKNVSRKSERDKTFENLIYSGGIFLIGLAITIYTYTNSMLEGGVYFVAFGPVIGGYIWFRQEWRKYLSLKDD